MKPHSRCTPLSTLKYRWRFLGSLTIAILTITTLSVANAASFDSLPSARRQNPTPTYNMLDYAPNQPYPWAYSYAGVVEGVNSLCIGGNYDEDHIVFATVANINNGYRTITEITPYNCGLSINTWIAEAVDIVSRVYQYAPNAAVLWGGLMFDEEAGYHYVVADLVNFNTYMQAVLGNSAGISWWFSEDRPVAWSLANYNLLISGSFQSPQVYSSGDPPVVNAECGTYYNCEQNITIDPSGTSGCFQTIQCDSGQIFGTPYSFWSLSGWYNIFNPV